MIGKRTPLARREALSAAVGDGMLLVRGEGSQGVNPNFVYLTGIDEPRAALLMAPEGVRIATGRNNPGPDYVRGRMAKQVLFLPVANPVLARWGEDAAATTDSVDPTVASVDAVLPVADLGAVLEQALTRTQLLHYVRGAPPRLAAPDDSDRAFVARLRQSFFALELRDATPTVHEMRRIKDASEVERIERAIAVTGDALQRTLPLLGDAVTEGELEGEIVRTYRSAGAGHAFDPIVGAGANANLLHYTANAGRLSAGEMLLVDTGARLDGYCSDVTRCYPVDGKFSKRQREVYEAVLQALREATAACRAGTLLADVHARAWDVLDRAGFAEHFIHGTSHHLGIETHDAGDVHRPLEPGCVITVEPGVYLADERLGIRLEDDVLVTEGEPRVLSSAIPIEPGEIEKRMA